MIHLPNNRGKIYTVLILSVSTIHRLDSKFGSRRTEVLSSRTTSVIVVRSNLSGPREPFTSNDIGEGLRD